MKCISPVFLFGLPRNLYQMAWLGPRLFQSSTSGLGLPTYGQISALVDPQFRCSSVPLSKESRKKNARGDLYRNSICSSPFQKSLVEPKRDGLVTHPFVSSWSSFPDSLSDQSILKGRIFQGRKEEKTFETGSYLPLVAPHPHIHI